MTLLLDHRPVDRRIADPRTRVSLSARVLAGLFLLVAVAPAGHAATTICTGQPIPAGLVVTDVGYTPGCGGPYYIDNTLWLEPPGSGLSMCTWYPVSPSTSAGSILPAGFVPVTVFHKASCAGTGFSDNAIVLQAPTPNLTMCTWYPGLPGTSVSAPLPVGYVTTAVFHNNSCAGSGFDNNAMTIHPPSQGLVMCAWHPLSPGTKQGALLPAGYLPTSVFNSNNCDGVGFADNAFIIEQLRAGLAACSWYPTVPGTTASSPLPDGYAPTAVFHANACPGNVSQDNSIVIHPVSSGLRACAWYPVLPGAISGWPPAIGFVIVDSIHSSSCPGNVSLRNSLRIEIPGAGTRMCDVYPQGPGVTAASVLPAGFVVAGFGSSSSCAPSGTATNYRTLDFAGATDTICVGQNVPAGRVVTAVGYSSACGGSFGSSNTLWLGDPAPGLEMCAWYPASPSTTVASLLPQGYVVTIVLHGNSCPGSLGTDNALVIQPPSPGLAMCTFYPTLPGSIASSVLPAGYLPTQILHDNRCPGSIGTDNTIVIQPPAPGLTTCAWYPTVPTTLASSPLPSGYAPSAVFHSSNCQGSIGQDNALVLQPVGSGLRSCAWYPVLPSATSAWPPPSGFVVVDSLHSESCLGSIGTRNSLAIVTPTSGTRMCDHYPQGAATVASSSIPEGFIVKGVGTDPACYPTGTATNFRILDLAGATDTICIGQAVPTGRVVTAVGHSSVCGGSLGTSNTLWLDDPAPGLEMCAWYPANASTTIASVLPQGYVVATALHSNSCPGSLGTDNALVIQPPSPGLAMCTFYPTLPGSIASSVLPAGYLPTRVLHDNRCPGSLGTDNTIVIQPAAPGLTMCTWYPTVPATTASSPLPSAYTPAAVLHVSSCQGSLGQDNALVLQPVSSGLRSCAWYPVLPGATSAWSPPSDFVVADSLHSQSCLGSSGTRNSIKIVTPTSGTRMCDRYPQGAATGATSSVPVDFAIAGVAFTGACLTTGSSTNSVILERLVTGGDADGDGLPDEIDPDDDNDGMSDDFEARHGLDPLDPGDASQDADNDGLANVEEASYGTDPRRADSDTDGLSDLQEIGLESDPNDRDTDQDGVADGDDDDPTSGGG